jgi:hypothetical protein
MENDIMKLKHNMENQSINDEIKNSQLDTLRNENIGLKDELNNIKRNYQLINE